MISCFSHTEKKIKDKYFLIAADSKDQTTISIQLDEYSFIGIVPQTVLEYALIDKFIFAKQVRLYDFEHENFSNFNYYVIRIGEEKSTKVTPKEFDNLLKENNIAKDKIKWKKT